MHNMLWFYAYISTTPCMKVALAGFPPLYMLVMVKLLTLKEKLLIAGLLALVITGLGVRQYRQSHEAETASSTLLSP